MNKLFKKGLVSLAAASVLASGVMADTNGVVDQTDANDFRVIVDKNSVTKGKDIILTVDLLKADGTLDRSEKLYGNTVDLKISTALGITTPIDDNLTSKGTSIIKINEDTLGTDDIQVAVIIKDSQGDAKILPAKSVTVDVTKAKNNAKGLEILEVSPSNATDGRALSFDGNSSAGTPKMVAGDSLVVKVEAIKSDDNQANNTKESAQNSEVTLRLIGTDYQDTDGNKVIDSGEHNKSVIATFTGTMTDGLAYINIPADTITEAGMYRLQVLTPTDNTAVTADNDGVRYAVSRGDYNLSVLPLAPAKVAIDVNSSGVDYLVRTKDGNVTNVGLAVMLEDKYGNLADKDKVTSDVKVKLSASNAVNIGGTYQEKEVPFTKSTDNLKNVEIAVSSAKYSTDLSVDSTTKKGSTTISIASNDFSLENGEAKTFDIYTYRLFAEMNQTLAGTINHILDNSDIDTLSSDANTTTAGAPFKIVDTNGSDFSKLLVKGNNDGETGIEGKQIKVTFLNADKTKSDSFSTIVNSDDNTTALRLTKANTYRYMKIEYAGSNGEQYAPVVIDLQNGLDNNLTTITVDQSNPAKINVYQLPKNSTYIYVDTTQKTPVTAVTVDKNQNVDNGKIYFDSNETNVTENQQNKHFLVTIEDTFGNAVTGSTKTVSFGSSLLTSLGSLTVDGNSYKAIDYSSKTAPQSDTLTLSGQLMDSVDISVEYVNTTAKLTTVDASFNANAVLVGGYIPFTVKAYDQNEKDMGTIDSSSNADKRLQVVISDASKVRVYELNATNGLQEKVSGDDINTSRSYFVKGITVGDVDVTIRNIAGTVKAVNKISVVKDIAELAAKDEANTATDTTTTPADPKAEVEDAVVEAGEMTVSGYFTAYDFNGDGTQDYNDWAYTVASNSNTYQLLGNPSSDTDLFGWKATDVTVNGKDWLMVHYGTGSLDWLVFKEDCSSVYKLSGAATDGTFSYDVNGDGTTDANDKLDLTCTVSNGKVTFSK